MKLFRFVIIFLATAALMSFLQGCNQYNGPASDHFDGSRFFNKEPGHTFFDQIKWLWKMDTVDWPDWVEDPPQPPPIARTRKGELRVTYINHATVLIQIDGINILTDPIWAKRAGPIPWVGVKRVRAPGVKMTDLPPIDIILISHDHYDHLDVATLRKLNESHRPKFIMGLGVKNRLESIGPVRIVILDWWQRYAHNKITKITFVPSRHNSGRGIFDKNRTLWGGFTINGSAGNVLFMGDTAFGGFMEDISKKFKGFRLAILPIGSYEKRWFMKTQHMNPDDAVRAHKIINAKQSLGVHFGTFKEHPEQTIDQHETDLKVALKKYHLPKSEFVVLKFGEGRQF